MEKHKNKALEEQCLCNKCPHKFECFTQERIFSDPIFQGLFEALMAQGMSKEDALEEVTEELKSRLVNIPLDKKDFTWVDNTTFTDWTYYNTGVAVPISNDNTSVYKGPNYVCSGEIENNGKITYHMANGKDVTWSASIW